MTNKGQLSASAGVGTQTSTQNPQNSTQAASLGQSQNVQTGTATSLLNNHHGITLQNTVVPTVALTSTSIRTAPPTPTSTHHTSPSLMGFSALLFVAAIVLFWTTAKPNQVKSTTE